MRLARIGEALGWGIITAAVVISLLFVSSTYGQAIESEARVYEADGRLEIEFVYGVNRYAECEDLYFAVRVDREEWEWPQWWLLRRSKRTNYRSRSRVTACGWWLQ